MSDPFREADRAVARAVTQISAALATMHDGLPEAVSMQYALEGVIRDLARHKDERVRSLLALAMRDPDIRDTYEHALKPRLGVVHGGKR